jgi:hypothetical protein
LCDPKVGWRACNKFMIFQTITSFFHCFAVNFCEQ